MKLIPVILCGGTGSRLWPVSREQHPKPFIRLNDGQSLLQKAFLRAAVLPNVVEISTATNRELFFKTRDEYREVNAAHIPTSLLLEPFGRNTAPAIAAAALQAQAAHGDDAILLILAADHLIADQAAFSAAVVKACQLAAAGKIVTFGIKPDTPETGYGYIEATGNSVTRFVEKPTLAKAEEYLRAGNYLWNAGIFCFSVATMLRELGLHAPAVLDSVRACLVKSASTENNGFVQTELDADSFAHAPDISIDYAIMEKSAHMAVVPCDIGWSDIGSWTAMGELSAADANGNRAEGHAVFHQSKNSYVRSEERVVGVVGVDDLLIIDTADALLVAHREHAQDVKHIFASLKASDHDTHKLHRTVHRPWGTYTVLDDGAGHKIKRIMVKPGASLSLQMHHHRSEHWVVVAGTAKVVNGEKELLLKSNESTYIPAGNKHRLENPGLIDLVIIEVQTGNYLGEDDIVRFKDEYGRVTPIRPAVAK